MITIILLLGGSVLIAALLLRLIWPRMVLSAEQRRQEGYQGTPDYGTFLGKTGIALTALRPAGSALIDKQRLNVVTEGEFLEKDTAIEVIRVEGYRLVVRQHQH